MPLFWHFLRAFLAYIRKKQYLCSVIKTILYRIGAYAWFYLHSGNTLGFGIHSPRLFYIANTLIPEQARYYCFEDIERERARVGHLARKAILPRRYAQLLFRLAVAQKARTVVELGTSVGLTTAYLAKADSHAQVYTFDHNAALLRTAKDVWKRLEIKNITAIEGNIDETLPAWITQRQDAQAEHRPTIDLAFMDANHTYEATLRYFDLLARYADEKAVFVLDDIRHSPQMYRAWQQISHREGVTATFDLGRMGMVFFDPHLPRQRFGIRM